MSVFALPFMGFFKNAKTIFITVATVVACIAIGTMLYKYSSMKNTAQKTAIAVVSDVANNNAIDTKTAIESAELKVEIVQENVAVKEAATKKEVAITVKKKEKIQTIKEETKKVVDSPVTTVAEKEEAKAKEILVVSTVQIDSLWDSYCNATESLSDAPLDQRLSCLI